MADTVRKAVSLNFFDTPLITPELAAAALIDAGIAASVGSVSVSTWNDLVLRGEAPQPVVRRTRCTRWRATDVAAFWRTWAEQPADEGTEKRAQIALKASQAAAAKRAAQKATESPDEVASVSASIAAKANKTAAAKRSALKRVEVSQ